jgi:hypothetical protein
LFDFLAPPQCPDELGRLGPYRVLNVLGNGGMGVVFEAEDPQLRRKVALKAMLPTLAASETARQRFLREAQMAAAIEHDHIVHIYQVGEDRGVPFIAMAFLKGEPLDRRLARQTQLPLHEVIRIGRETAAGVAAAHKQGLIHRDIKPANLWLEAETGRVKILDFGLARAAVDTAHLTQSGAIVGTPAYMAPEQVNGQTLDARCDLFSIGCVLYQLSTGELPFKGNDTIATLMAVATQQPPPPRALNPALPQEFSDLVMRLLAKDVAQRTPTAQSLLETLAACDQQRAVATASYHGIARRQPRVVRPLTRRWLLLGVASAALASLVLAGLIVVRQATDKQELVIKTEAVSPRESTSPLTPTPGVFAPLFNGKDLTGWQVIRGDAGAWQIEQGGIGFTGADLAHFGSLVSDKEYTDYAVRFEFQADDKARAGFVVRSVPSHGTLDGPGGGVIIAADQAAGTFVWSQHGDHLPSNPTPQLQPPRHWNRMEIRLQGRRLRVLVNNAQVQNLNLDQIPDRPITRPYLRRAKGTIGFTKVVGTVRMRNIELRDLSNLPPPTDSVSPAKLVLSPQGRQAIAVNGEWLREPDALVQTDLTTGGRVFFGDAEWTDYDFSCEAMRLAGPHGFDLIVRAADKYNYNILVFGGWNNTKHGWTSVNEGVFRDFKGWRNAGIIARRWYRVRVSVRGPRCWCYLGDELVFDFANPKHRRGAVGFSTFKTKVRFRNIKVTAPDGKVLWEGVPELDAPEHKRR